MAVFVYSISSVYMTESTGERDKQIQLMEGISLSPFISEFHSSFHIELNEIPCTQMVAFDVCFAFDRIH